MRRSVFLWVLLLLGAVITACSADSASHIEPTLPPAEANTTNTQSDNADLRVMPRPSEPPALDEWREDHPAHVANTGRPQLVEFFSYT